MYNYIAGQPLTDCQVQQQHERKLSYYLDRSAVKKQKQETSGASVSVNMISPGPKFNTKGEYLTKMYKPFTSCLQKCAQFLSPLL